MAPSSARNSGRRTRVDPRQLSEQILDSFSAKAKRSGIRALIMNELASELRMSASTLYKLFPSKEALAAACVDRWADELGAAKLPKRDRRVRDGFDQFLLWAEAWADANASISPDFARDLRTDYPAVWRRYREIIAAHKRRGAALLRPLLKPDVDPGVAFALLDQIFTTVLAPEFAEKLQISRREALSSAVAIWAGGALSRRGKLRSLRGRVPTGRG